MKNVIGIMILLTTIISGGSVIYSEAGSSGDDLSIQKTEIADKIIQQDAQADPDNISDGNSIHVQVNASEQENFTALQVKNITHHIYWDDNDVPEWANFTQGYIRIKWDINVCTLLNVQSGLFATWLYRTIRPGEVVLWTWQIGPPPLTNSQSEVAFTVTFKGTDAGGTTDLTYAIASSTGGSRTWFWAGSGAHSWIQVPAVVEYAPMVQPPAAPSNLVATAVSAYQIDLTWQDNSDNEDGFKIEGKVNCFSDFVQIAKVGADVTGYSDKRALAGVPHFYRVRAYNEAGDSSYSNIASATTSTPLDDILSALDRLYQEGAIKAGLYNPLLVKLQAAQNAQNFNAALGQLNAFSNQVQAQSGKGVTTEASQALLALNAIAIAYINPDKIASGYAVIATFKPADYPAVRIEARETPEPYVPKISDSRAYVFRSTPGVLNLYYYDAVGQCVNINRNIEINNITRVIYYNGAPVTTIREIFSDLLHTPAGDYMYLTMDFPYWLTIFMTPVSHLQIQSYMDDFTTDKGRPIKTIPDGWPWPPPPDAPPWYTEDEARDRTITEVNNSSINGHSIGALISMGVITPTVITPTDSYNCWGWTFTCGSAWMTNPIDVDKVLSDNGYTQITPTASAPAQPGDVIVYRDERGNVTHTGIVRKVDPATGWPTLVESKWDRRGQYLHPPETVPADYLPEGGKIEYWRAPATRQAPANSTDPDKERHTLPVG